LMSLLRRRPEKNTALGTARYRGSVPQHRSPTKDLPLPRSLIPVLIFCLVKPFGLINGFQWCNLLMVRPT
jgi:hypothetical protein